MPRFCRACGRPLDSDHHDRASGQQFAPDGNRHEHDGSPVLRRVKGWTCRVRRLADQTAADLSSGERKVTSTFVPADTVNQRRTRGSDANNLRFVPLAILKLRQGQ